MPVYFDCTQLGHVNKSQKWNELPQSHYFLKMHQSYFCVTDLLHTGFKGRIRIKYN